MHSVDDFKKIDQKIGEQPKAKNDSQQLIKFHGISMELDRVR